MLQLLLAFKLLLILGNLEAEPENLQGLFLTAGSGEKGLFFQGAHQPKSTHILSLEMNQCLYTLTTKIF